MPELENREPLVSIVIDNFNYERFLPRSIGSALAQTYPNVEVVVVDDRSTDGSPAIIRSHGDRIVAVLKTVNEGHGAAMNAGFAACRGEIVMLLDADDYLAPDAAASVVAAMVQGVAQVQYRLDLVDAEGVRLDLYPLPEVAFDDGDVTPLLAATGRYSTTVTSGLAFSRAVLEQVLPMPAEAFRQGGDGYLVTVAPLYGRVVSIERALGAYCKHGGNHSQWMSKIAERARWRLTHDDARYAALADHGMRQGLTIAPTPGLSDPNHIEERLASLTLDPDRHPVRTDRRARLGIAGARMALRQNMDAKRRYALAATYLAAGLVPRPIAAKLIAWKMEASTRPAFVGRWIRRVARRAG